MSVIIKGFVMPNDCLQCNLLGVGAERCFCEANDNFLEGDFKHHRADNCPLYEIQDSALIEFALSKGLDQMNKNLNQQIELLKGKLDYKAEIIGDLEEENKRLKAKIEELLHE